MNNDYNNKRKMYGILAILSAILFVSPVDLMTGLQVDDIGYLLTTIITTILNFKMAQPPKNYQEVDN
ncbi:MAG: hypothetical protein KBS43_02880 [Oscillospiraceae bacterium]|nr:hypothetical protein [Candidatus Limimonas coprohippi]MCQ2488101.1 hypothetical protein [Clostridia bacterium]